MTDASDRPRDEAERLESLVARVCELALELGPAAVERVCSEAPEHAAAVRAQLARLEGFGMLPPELRTAAGDDDGRFELLAPLGAGGMGVVYRARDTDTGAIVALKTLDPRIGLTERLRARFRREIDAVRRVEHPNVVGVVAVGEREGLPYYAMPFVDGATLAEFVARARRGRSSGPVPALADLEPRDGERELRLAGRSWVEGVCRLALDVARGLGAVHAAGVVHRDVKPSNVLVDGEGRGLLFDLGLAHLVDDTRLTLTGDFAGSPHYAAPEQIDGPSGAIDARTDLWGLGATLFEALALRPPFEGASAPEILRRIARDEPPRLRQVAPWVPRDLETLVACCLEREPARRYASADELARDLERFLDFRPVQARPIGRLERTARLARRNRAATAAIALGAAVLVGTPIGLWQHSQRVGVQRDRATAAAVEARREADENREVSRFLESLILGLDRTGREGDRAAARGLLTVAEARLEAGEDLRPLTRASLRATLARVLEGMGRIADAVPLLDRSLSIRHAQLGEAHAETAATIQELAALHLHLGDHASARGLVERGLRSADALAAAPRAAALAEENRAALAAADGHLDAAVGHLAHSLELLRTLSSPLPDAEARVLMASGALHLERGHHALATAAASEALAVTAAGAVADDALRIEALELLARAHDGAGRPDEAADARDRALALRRKLGRVGEPATVALLEALIAHDTARSAATDDVDRRARTERLVLLGEGRATLGRGGAVDAFERARAAALELDGASGLLGRALVGLARAAVDVGNVDEAAGYLRHAAGLPRTPSPESAWADALCLAGLEFEARHRRTVDGLGVDAVAEWFSGRAARASSGDRELSSLLRRAALLALELGAPDRARALLADAATVDARLASDGAPIGLDYRSLLADSYSVAMQRGITCLQSERWRDAIDAFEVCAAARPEDPVARYNAACAWTHLGRTDEALAELAASVERGYAFRERAVELTRADPDLAGLRADPRFDALLARMQALVDAAAAFAAEPRVYAPPDLDRGAPVPALFVLHGDGSTHDAVVAGPWRELADRLGWLLVAPSGRIPAALDPEHGMLWTDSLARYAARARYYEEPVRAADALVRREWTLDRERVFIAGEGLGGTLAFHIAARSPELFRGCLLVDASVPLELVEDLAPRLGELNLRAALLVDPARRPLGVPDDVATTEYLSRTFAQLERWGVPTTVGTRARADGDLDVEWVARAVEFLEHGG